MPSRGCGDVCRATLVVTWPGDLSLDRGRERIPASRQYLRVDEKLRSGPIEAPADFEDAFREHFAPVYRFIARRVGTGLAEDLAAESFATAYRRRASYDPDHGSLRPWLFGIATNIVREHWRDEQHMLELDAALASGGTRSFDDDADSRVVATALAPRIRGALPALNRRK